MNTYMIVGEVGLRPTPRQRIDAETAREAVGKFQATHPGYRIVKVWILQEIAKEFWSD